MRIDYPTVIEESEAQLLDLEQQHRGQRSADRLRLLWLLKNEAIPTLQAAFPVLG